MSGTEKATGKHYTFETCHKQGYAENGEKIHIEKENLENIEKDMQKTLKRKSRKLTPKQATSKLRSKG